MPEKLMDRQVCSGHALCITEFFTKRRTTHTRALSPGLAGGLSPGLSPGLDSRYTTPKSADVEDNFRKTVGQALGGAVLLLGAGSAYLQFLQQQRASSLQFLRQQQASHDLLISNQVSKGFELLGNKEKDAVVLRLGGIYALEGVMNNSYQYHQAVLEELCAFVREGARLPTTPPPPEPPPPQLQRPPTDIQAALTVIGRREAGLGIVELTEANIAGADLTFAHLTFAHLNGPT